MLIGRYSEKYRGDILSLIEDFHKDALSEFGMSLDLNILKDTIEELKEYAFLLINNEKCIGLIAGKKIEIPYSNDNIWHETIWYVRKDYRKYGVWLLRETCKILKEEGYTKMVMVCMENSSKDRIFRVYQHLGFMPMEHHFIRSL